MTFSEKEIEKQMKANHCTRQEAIDILTWDYEIDHGNTENGAMTAEQKALVRKLTKADKDPTVKKTVKRERKIDENKETIFKILKAALENSDETLTDLSFKNESEISFTYMDEKFSVKLTKHRMKKA